jgi:hypothetical protein
MGATATVATPSDARSAPDRVSAKNPPAGGQKTGSTGALLGNNANNLATAGQRHDQRQDARIRRWDARAVLWALSNLDRCRKCGRITVTESGLVGVRANGASVGYSGLATCGSVWACPVCNSKIQAVRRLEVGTAAATVLGNGGAVLFGTFTLRHTAAVRLDPLWRSLRYAWEGVLRDGTVRRTLAALGHIGYVLTCEITDGENGWHPHLHALLCFDRRLLAVEIERLSAALIKAWCRAASRDGLDALEHVQDVRPVTGSNLAEKLSDYLTKSTFDASGVAWEMTSTQTKGVGAVGKTRPVWELLHEVIRTGDADALDRWHEYERASKGKRSLTWSKGLRTWVGLRTEATDDVIVSTAVGTAEDTGLVIHPEGWAAIVRRPTLGAQLLGVVGPEGNWAAGAAFLDQHRIEYSRVGGR